MEPKKKTIRNTLLSIFIPLIAVISLIIPTTIRNLQPDDPNVIEIGISNDNLDGQYYEDVIELLEGKGFTNIEVREENWSLFHKSGTVKSVIIDGKDEYYSSSKFSKDAKIIIFYYK